MNDRAFTQQMLSAASGLTLGILWTVFVPVIVWNDDHTSFEFNSWYLMILPIACLYALGTLKFINWYNRTHPLD